MIGSGAVIIENGTVGDNCAVGTNAAVFKDVPKEATVVGVLARIVSVWKDDNEKKCFT